MAKNRSRRLRKKMAPPQPQETEPTAPKKQSGAIGVE